MNPCPVGEEPSSQQQRVILLGASNIARGFSTVVHVCQNFFTGPLDLIAASGHGRGYGLESWVLGRSLPPILECGLWTAVTSRHPLDTVALLTDIGNDLVFGASPDRVATWVEQCLERLSPLSNRIIITELPVDSVLKLGVARFRLMRTLLFPRSILTHGVALEHVRQLNEAVVELASRYDAHLVRPAERWYGFDPIHVKQRCKTEAWQTILSAGSGQRERINSTPPRTLRWSLCCVRQQHRRLLDAEQARVLLRAAATPSLVRHPTISPSTLCNAVRWIFGFVVLGRFWNRCSRRSRTRLHPLRTG